MELLHLSHSDQTSTRQDRAYEESALYDTNHSTAVIGGGIHVVVVREEYYDKDTANQQDNHQELKQLDALLEYEERQYECHKWAHVIDNGNHRQRNAGSG